MKQIIAACLGLALAGFLPGARAEIVQGQLELRWGDPIPVHGKSQSPSRFVATLVGDDGTRRTLDPAQARRAAGDLYALANRRVAVEFSRPSAAAVRRPSRPSFRLTALAFGLRQGPDHAQGSTR